ncbi:UNVERIFIED_CONTAM: hypothetical protein Sindi_0741600 [Sesamum indicum]
MMTSNGYIIYYFQSVFASNHPRDDDIARGTEHLCRVVDDGMREDLVQPYTEARVTRALYQMASFKSPDPDASKTIANRLKVLLDRIISPAQFAFVLGRLITDNIFLAFELNHYLNTKTTGKQSFMALKLDVSKAYDKVEWTFLEQIMSKHGFSSPFIRLVMLCVTFVSFSFLLGASQFGHLIPELGLRQGMRFWWNNRGSSKIHWVSYQCMCESKLKSGLGFRHLHLFNQAMLVKQLWLIMCCAERILSCVLKAQYFPNNDIFSATLGHHPSFTWRSLMSAQELFWAGFRWRVGFGCDDIMVWHFSSTGLFNVSSAYHLACELENRSCWSGLLDTEQGWWRSLWQAKLPNKVKEFICKACLNDHPTNLNLARRIPTLSAACLFC